VAFIYRFDCITISNIYHVLFMAKNELLLLMVIFINIPTTLHIHIFRLNLGESYSYNNSILIQIF
jgi:hypothetical protein